MSKFEKWNDRIWNFFASVDLAVALFIVISIGAAIGTVIPQSQEPETTIRFFLKFLSMNQALKAYEIVSLLDLNNLYHSWWFTFLLFMFALNLIVCSIDRLPNLLKSLKTKPREFPLQTLEKMPIKREFIISEPVDIGRVDEILRKKGYSNFVFKTDGAIQLLSKKWSKTRLAVYLTHFSILIILVGALMGTFFGFRGIMNIVEGTGLNFVLSDGGKPIPLGFEVRCDKFEVEYYEHSAMPKSFRSYLRIIEEGRPVKFNGKEQVLIEVNQPFTYKGISFYQSSYGFQPSENAEFRFTFYGKDGKQTEIKVHFEEKFKIPNTSALAAVVDFSPALGVNEKGELINLSSEMINPAVLLVFEESGKKSQQWILRKIPETWETPYGKLQFNELWGAQFTGLQVRKDPGVPLIYIGSILLCIGLFISLFLRPITYFWVITKDKIRFYSPSSRGSFIIEKNIEQVIKQLKGE